jgi:uncharacterized protein (TIGR02145 family)
MKSSIISFFLLVTFFGFGQTMMNIHLSDGSTMSIALNTVDSITYSNVQIPGSPIVTTLPVQNVSTFGAELWGSVVSEGSSAVTQRGICYSTETFPDLNDYYGLNGEGPGDFNLFLSGLLPNTTYYIRAYATNDSGTSFGDQLVFTTLTEGAGNDHLNASLNYGTVSDIDGNSYPTIVIGSQEWMAENLRTTKFANGESIALVSNALQWEYCTAPAWVYPQNNSALNLPYGKLYNFYAVQDPRNVCPTGWHIPSQSEWETLVSYLDPTGNSMANNAGDKLKSVGINYWNSPNIGTNESGFSAIGAPDRDDMGNFNDLGVWGSWWTNTVSNPDYVYYRYANYGSELMGESIAAVKSGASVRCLRD